MTGKNDFSPIVNQVLDGRDSSSNSGIVSDDLTIVQRDIQIGPHKHLLTFQFGGGEVSDALLGHGGDAPRGLAGGLEGSELGSDVEGEKRVSGGAGEAKAAGGGAEEASGGKRGGGIERRSGAGSGGGSGGDE